MNLLRSAGLQLHVTSLPGGRLGPQAHAFVDWLADAGQSWWQVLPLGPPDEHRSPYKAASAFAAWPGLLAEPRAAVGDEEIAAFRARQGFWLDDWERYAGPGSVADQVRFDREWGELRAHARTRGVRLLGDVPIYVAPGSSDHLAHPELFRGGAVAGAPPDDFNPDGQHWGNPLYDWPALQRRGYRWWIERLRRSFELFDAVRIDHFRGFVAYWAVPEGVTTAREGAWRRGPGRAVFDAATAALAPSAARRAWAPGEPAPTSPLPILAEDLGAITPPVTRLRRELGLPGMVVLQFAFDPEDPRGPHRLERHEERSAAYTATHDTDTLRGWWESATPAVRAGAATALREAGLEGDVPWWGLLRLLYRSPARLAMSQVQDVLGLGSDARMNRPGVEGGNWDWELPAGALTAGLAGCLRAATAEAGRLPHVA
ncbi:MAG: 4-alpha-glucanotransferase [Solirubrobacteraceae bacterium MAG38_C4-C5]|nr:4-alpha-glucanotransferase [Candidatus Siliceabacter maunaloa]